MLFSISTYAQQGQLAQFAIWKPKEGQLQNFENGYKKHLNWHKSNGDTWNWYAWFIISGPRYGQFVDATFNHSWMDFDHAVKPVEDLVDNRLHVFPFADIQTVFKVIKLPQQSLVDTFNIKQRLIRVITLDVNSLEPALKVIDRLKENYKSGNIKSFTTYKVIDGGETRQLLLLLGFNNWEEYASSEAIDEKITAMDTALTTASIAKITSETMVFRPDLSLFQNN
ncbi:hypothetical protein C3K47_01580 [Solitalea longa]|uniref:NIPSNAP domain-containing protein n=2 Tax=Solitalea longa TaxID=2079460 RepID=A0A2S5A9E8_9SPHI|nr:hypothetical protein C3K47_01580 [Solitalea longa]